MTQAEQEKFALIITFLQVNAEAIYDCATKKYTQFLDSKNVQKKKLKIHKNQAIRVITALANFLEDSKQGTIASEKVGERVANQSISHDATLEEAVDGVIMLKQATWEELEQAGFLYTLTVQELYLLISLITAYYDSITSNIALVYHNHYNEAKTNNSYGATLTENIIDAVISTDNEYKIVSWNKGAETLYGWSMEEVHGKYAIDVLNTELSNYPYGSKGVQEAVAQQGLWKGEAVQRRRDGTKIAVLAFISAVKDSMGNTIGTVAVNRDITERKRNEMDTAFLVTMSERIRLSTDADELVADVTRLTGEYFHARRCYLAEVFGNEDRWTIKRDYHATLPSIAGEYRLSDYDTRVIHTIMAGRTRVAEDTKTDPLTSGHYKTSYEPIGVRAFITVPCRRNGHTAAFLMVSVAVPRQWQTREIALLETVAERLWNGIEKLRSEQALRVSREKQEETLAILESLLKNAPIGFAFFNQEHRYIRVNDTLATLNGIAAQDHIGKTIEELLPENAKTVVPVLEEVMKTKEPVIDLEVVGNTPKEPGVTRYWLTGFYPVFIGKSTDVDFVGAVVIEITAMKRLEKQKDEFLAVASHELKTPVTSIKAYTQVLQRLFKSRGDTQSAAFLAKMDAQINKLITLIADLLDVSKMQTGKLPLRLNDFDFDALVSEIVDEIQRTTSHHIIYSKDAKSTSMYGDRDRIEQVITNLLTNAVKYSPQADRVLVQTHTDGETITMSVQDFGLGIPKEKQKNVFERFYRVHGSKENTYPGLGLGLYIASDIIHRHGGTIWLESAEGEGSTFCFTLPIQNRALLQENAFDEEVAFHE